MKLAASLFALALCGCALKLDFPATHGPATGGGGGAGGTTSSSTTTSTSASTGSGGALCAPGATAACYDGPTGTEGVGLCKAGQKTCAADGANWSECAGEVLPQPEDCTTPEDEDCDGKFPACAGTLRWAKRVGGAVDQRGLGIATDPAGNVVAVGFLNGSGDFGAGPLTVALVYGLAVGGDGAPVVTGQFTSAVDFGSGALTSAGSADVFVAKFDPAGATLWTKRYGDAASQIAIGIAADQAGNIVVTGEFQGAVDFGGGPLASAGAYDIFVAKLGADGAHTWSKRYGLAGDQKGMAVTIDPTGKVILTGEFYGSVDFGGNVLVSGGSGVDIFLVKLGADASHVWSTRFGDVSDQIGMGVATDQSSNIFLTGYMAGTVDFGGGALPSAGGTDLYVASFGP